MPGDQDGHDPLVPRGPQRPSEVIADELGRQIAADEWAVDEAMPTVAQLADHYQ